MYTQRSKYWPAYTWEIQKSYSKNIKDKITSELKLSKGDFGEMYSNVFHKINASFYHLQRLKENQEIALKIGQTMVKIKIPGTEKMIGVAGVPYEPTGYEYETFIVTIKSALDFISILIAKSFGWKEDNILSLINRIKLRKVNTKQILKEKICAFLENYQFTELIGSFKKPGQGRKSKRDFTVHKGPLPVGTINIPINNPKATTLLTKALDPNDPKPHFSSQNTPDLIKYCEDQFYQTCDLFTGILSILSDNQFTPGPKVSVYEQRRKK